MDASAIHAGMLVDPAVCRTCADSHSCNEFMSAVALSWPEEVYAGQV